MDPAAAYLLVALRSGREGFARRHALGFLVRRPATPGVTLGDSAPSTEDVTGVFKTNVYDTASTPDDAETRRLDPRAWILVAVGKRRGNPYPERIGVGRARNCDVVLRYGAVSKLHAHFLVGDAGEVHLSDNRSRNGTFVDGRRVEPGAPVPVRFGSVVQFGTLDLEYASPETVYDLLQPG